MGGKKGIWRLTASIPQAVWCGVTGTSAESTELHRISLLFHLMIVRLVAEDDALLPQPRQPLAVDLDTVGSGSRGVVSENIAHVVEQPGG